MSELHKFLFDGLPVRGVIVRLTDAQRAQWDNFANVLRKQARDMRLACTVDTFDGNDERPRGRGGRFRTHSAGAPVTSRRHSDT